MEHREQGVQEVAGNLPEENMNHAWVTVTGRQPCQGCSSVGTSGTPEEDKQAEAGRPRSRTPAPPRGRIARCVHEKQSSSRAGPGLRPAASPPQQRKQLSFWTRCWGLLRAAEERIGGDTRSFGKGDQRERTQSRR